MIELMDSRLLGRWVCWVVTWGCGRLAVARQPAPRLPAATAPRFPRSQPKRYTPWKNNFASLRLCARNHQHHDQVRALVGIQFGWSAVDEAMSPQKQTENGFGLVDD